MDKNITIILRLLDGGQSKVIAPGENFYWWHSIGIQKTTVLCIAIDSGENPKQLAQRLFCVTLPWVFSSYTPIKAGHAKAYLSGVKVPLTILTFFFTTDFKSFKL